MSKRDDAIRYLCGDSGTSQEETAFIIDDAIAEAVKAERARIVEQLNGLETEPRLYALSAFDRDAILAILHEEPIPEPPPPVTPEEYHAAIAATLCPACEGGYHWTHRTPDGVCLSIDRVHDHVCPCPWRPMGDAAGY